MNVYSVVCLETGDYNTLFTSAEKATNYLYNVYNEYVDFSDNPIKDTIKVLKKKCQVDFYFNNGEIVKVTKVKVY